MGVMLEGFGDLLPLLNCFYGGFSMGFFNLASLFILATQTIPLPSLGCFHNLRKSLLKLSDSDICYFLISIHFFTILIFEVV
jgi:hypothetical protein